MTKKEVFYDHSPWFLSVDYHRALLLLFQTEKPCFSPPSSWAEINFHCTSRLGKSQKRYLFRRTRWWKPRNLCRCVSRKRQLLNNITIYKPCCVFSLQKQPKSQAMKLYHGLIVHWIIFNFAPWSWPFSAKCRGSLHKGESPNVVGTPTTCGGQRINGKWPQKNIKKHPCRSIL